MSNVRFDEATEKKLKEAYEAPDDWDWAAASAKLTAYGSPPVLHATRVSQARRLQIAGRFKPFTTLVREARSRGLEPGAPGTEQVMAARRAPLAARPLFSGSSPPRPLPACFQVGDCIILSGSDRCSRGMRGPRRTEFIRLPRKGRPRWVRAPAGSSSSTATTT
jgi:hypothetical protein